MVFFFGLMVGALVRLPVGDLAAAQLESAAEAGPVGEPKPDPEPEPAPPPRPPTDGVILLTGTWSAFEFWPVVVEGKVSFASELVRVMNQDGDTAKDQQDAPQSGHPGVEVDLIADANMLDNSHASRVRNAQYLAEVIDDLATRVDRVHIIAHSHGGNVALHAAGLCKAPIQTVICLSTPHVLYELRDAKYKTHLLPVYLTPQGRQNIKTLITVTPSTDKVASTYAGLSNGLAPGKANQLIAAWKTQLGPLRPSRGPDPIADLLGKLPRGDHDPNLNTHHVLPQADTNIVYTAHTGGRFTIDAHNSSHSRAIGALLGPILRDGPLPKHLKALQDFEQPKTADDGWPKRS